MANSVELTAAVITATGVTDVFEVLKGENFDIVASVESAITGGDYTLQLQAKVILKSGTVIWVNVGAVAVLDSADDDDSIQLTLLAVNRTAVEYRVDIVDGSATHDSTDGIRLLKSSAQV